MKFFHVKNSLVYIHSHEKMIYFNYIDLFGFFAALLTTIAFLPQLYKTWKTKSADDVSLIMLILFIIGLFCWIIYGFKINSIPILFANIITFIFNFSILILKITYSKNSQ